MAETMEHDLDHEDANEHIEKVLEIVELSPLPNITTRPSDALRAFPRVLNGEPAMRLARIEHNWVTMDDPNITMEEYIRLEEENARRRSKCEPTVSSLKNDEIDFRISFDEFDNEDCMVIFKKSFSYKIISVNNLKTYSENDNDKVNMPLLPSPEPTVSYFDDLDYFKDFEKEFPAIVYNDAQMSKLNFLTEATLSPQHIDEFNLKNETSLSECHEEEQNVLNFNDLFPFNVVYPDDLKSDKDNDDDKIDIEHSLGDLSVKPLPDVINTDVGGLMHRWVKKLGNKS
ncbi:hypothetical protein Tco_0442738 [Tanacetum coccineum]